MMGLMRVRDIVVLVALVVLAGCGYRPLYGTQGAGAVPVEDRLASIRIGEPSSRREQLVRNELMSEMATSAGTGAGYTLKLNVTNAGEPIITFPSPRESRRSLVLTVNYQLFGSDAKKPLTSGKVVSNVSYDVVRQPFADQQASDNALERAAKEAAGEIRTRLAVYFSRQP